MDIDKDKSKSFYLFGRDIAEIPCFRDSFLYGISTGIVSGLGYFMFTSRARMATHVAFGGFMLTTLGYWCNCRYNYALMKFEMLQIQGGLRQKVLQEGTSVEDAVEQAAIEHGLDLKKV